MKHLFPYLNADDSISKENERVPHLVTQKLDFCIPLEYNDWSVGNYFEKWLIYDLKYAKIWVEQIFHAQDNSNLSQTLHNLSF